MIIRYNRKILFKKLHNNIHIDNVRIAAAVPPKRLIRRRGDNIDNNTAVAVLLPSWSSSSLIGGGVVEGGGDGNDERTADGRPTLPSLPRRVPGAGRRHDAHHVPGTGLQHATGIILLQIFKI